ncbi:DUF6898 family protein [Polycladidibacter hongkongensis]|uniref:DUF6898 family protein n=1 Tax=Polycladidibacter hongkongensis TaxID=1647556 RepID=UPI000832BF78|nr:hypothetical protein [Pseudovibrio hongkongensis]
MMADTAVYFEFVPLGAQVKVSAICASTGVEVSLLVPKTTPQTYMQDLALRKLRRRLAQD